MEPQMATNSIHVGRRQFWDKIHWERTPESFDRHLEKQIHSSGDQLEGQVILRYHTRMELPQWIHQHIDAGVHQENLSKVQA